jgi:hypothetical protein
MKKLIIAAAALMVSLAAYGQGQFVFNNRVLPDINARFVSNSDPTGGTTSSIGDQFQVQLFNSANGTLTAIDPASTTFRGAAGAAAAGYVTPTTETVAGVAPGANASIVLKVTGPGTDPTQQFGPYTVALGGGTITPPNLPLGTTPLVVNLVPEPSTLALGFLGVGALLAIRRRK